MENLIKALSGAHIPKVVATTVMVILMMISATSVAFAADPIEIRYSGGSKIDDVARVNAYDVNHLYPISRSVLKNTAYFGGPWTEMELQSSSVPGKAVTIPTGTKVWENTGFICDSQIEVNGEYYDLKLTLLKTVNKTSNKAFFWKRYSGPNIDVWAADVPSAVDNMPEGVFCSCDVEILKHGTNERLELEDLWLCVSDLDCSQSFSSTNIDVTPSNMLIKKKGQFSGYKVNSTTEMTGNAYVNETGLYSTPWANAKNASAGDGADLFLGVAGMDHYNMIFGFRSAAGSPLSFYTTKNKVEYKSVKGTITGINSEVVIEKGSPSGSSQKPDERHAFVKWTSNIDVALRNGEVIAAGEVITDEQIRNAVIVEDTVFTAYNQPVFEIVTSVVNGTITPSESGIPVGQNRRVIYEPDDGYQLKTLTVDEEDMDIREYPSSVAFENISGNHIVRAEYEKIPALEVTKKADVKVCRPGDRVTYTINVVQTVEGAEARDIVIKDVLPEGLILDEDSIEGDVKVVSVNPGGYEITIDSLQYEMSYTYTAVTDSEKEGPELMNVVTVKGGNVPGDPLKATEIIASLSPKPVLSKTVSNETPEKGEEITYTISAKETQEGIRIDDVIITDRLPEGIEYVEGSLTAAGDEASCEISEGVITVRAEKLSSEIVITFKAKVTADSGKVVNRVNLKGGGIPELEAEAVITVKEKSPDPVVPEEPEKDPGDDPVPFGNMGPSTPETPGTNAGPGPTTNAEEGTTAKGNVTGSPRTGDQTDPGLILLLMLLAAALVASVLGFRKILRR